MPGISFLFWNVNQSPLRDRIARLVVAHSVDVVILAECTMQSSVVSRALNDVTGDTFRVVPGSGSELRLFTRFAASNFQIEQREQFEAWLAFRVNGPILPELILYAVHLPSKLWTTENDQILVTSNLAGDIRLLEQQQRHDRTVVVGDLNANPFELQSPVPSDCTR